MMKTLSAACITAALILTFTLCLAGMARAQIASTPTSNANNSSAVVPADHWAYQALDTIQRSGIAVANPKGLPFGQVLMTRRDFAEVTARLLRVIKASSTTNPDLTSGQKASENKMEGSQQAQDALLSLTDEFTQELKAMNVDIAGAKGRLAAMEERLATVEAEERRVKITDEWNFIARDTVNTNTTGTKPLDKNGYRIVSAGTRRAGDAHTVNHRLHKRSVHSRHHRHRRKVHRNRRRF